MKTAIQALLRIIRFLFDQVRKTINRPERVYIILWGMVRSPVLKVFGPGILLVNKARPLNLIPRPFQSYSAAYYFAKGTDLLSENRPREAWRYFRKCLETSRDPFHFYVAAACLLVGLGRYENAMALLTRANALRTERAVALGFFNSQIRFLEPIWIAAFGHLAQLQYVIKLNILENRRREDTILYLPPEVRVVNHFLLDQWRPHINVIDKESDLPLPLDKLKALTFDFYAPQLADGSTAYYWDAAEQVNQRWRAEKRGPLLTLPSDIERRGVEALSSVGINPGGWFVALHVRESASNKHHAGLHNVLNSSIADYFPAIKHITDRGGWVIRLGDPNMMPLPAMPNVLDYCHSEIRSDWMDVFLLAKCRFFLGTSSGPAYVPGIYGVPSVLTNWWPYGQRPWDEKAIFLPKLYRNLKSGAPLKLSQALSEPFGYCNSVDYIAAEEGVIVEDNSPEDMRDAVVEMIERLEGTVTYAPADLRLQERAARIFEVAKAHGAGDLAREYLRRNVAIID